MESESPPDELVTAVSQLAGRDIVALAETLLRYCRAHKAQLRAELDDPRRHAARLTAFHDAQAFFTDELDSEYLEEEVVPGLVKLLREGADQVGHPVAALAMAEALDEVHGHRFAGCFRGRGVVQVHANDAFPVVRVPLAELIKHGLTPDPDTLNHGVDRTERLRLRSPGTPHDVFFSWDAEDELAALPRAPRIGIALPNADVSGNHATSELVWRRYTDGATSFFFSAGPRDENRQHQLISDLLTKAVNAGAHVVVFPELSFTDRILERIKQARRDSRTALPPIVLAGSRHVEIGGRKYNEANLLLGMRDAAHRKFEPFAFIDNKDDGTPGPVERHEDVVRAPSLVVHFSGRWSVTVLICKDFMTQETTSALVDLAVRMVLVASFSPKTQPLHVDAAYLAVQNQAVVAVANTAAGEHHTADVAIVAAPRRDPHIVERRRRDVRPPALLVCKMADKLDLHDA